MNKDPNVSTPETALVRIEKWVDDLYEQMQTPEYRVAAERAMNRRPRVRLRKPRNDDSDSSPS